MTKHVNAESIIRGNFCDIVKFFRGRDLDAVDRLAQRALNIILRTDHLEQTGYEVDTDPFSANMFAGAALGSISASIKQYPFVRVSPASANVAVCETAEQQDAVLDSAEDMMEMAEGLIKAIDPATLMSVLAAGFRTSELR